MRLNRSNAPDIFIVIFCLTGSIICLFLFWMDLNSTLTRMGEQPVGTITFRYNTAQRRFIDRQIWDRLRTGSQLYNGDIIRTADVSEATITFDLGDMVDLSSNTLVQIFSDASGSRIDLADGDISVTAVSDRGIVIVSGDNEVTIQPGTVLRATTLNGEFNITVSNGAASLERGSQIQAVQAGSSLALSATGETLSIPRAAAISPIPSARILSQSATGATVDFLWNPINYPPNGQTRLEIAEDRSFSRIIYARTLANNSVNALLPEGTWFWRLIPMTGDVPAGASVIAPANTSADIPYTRIVIYPNPIPALISPTNGQEVQYRSRLPALSYRWTSSPDALLYLLEAADNPAMEEPALSLQVSPGEGDQTAVIAATLGEGDWYWRVSPVYDRSVAGTPRASAIQRFSIASGAPLSSPILIAPADNGVVNIDATGRDIIFSWMREPEAATYTLLVSAASDMSSPLLQETLSETYYRYRPADLAITPGLWYWTVHYTAPDSENSPSADVRAFAAEEVGVVQRQVFPPENYTVMKSLLAGMRFTWRTNLVNARFQISLTDDFAELLIDEPSPFESYTIGTLQSDTYYWRITGGTEAAYQESAGWRLQVIDSLPPPVLQTPTGGFVSVEGGLLVINQDQSVNFSWNPIVNAESYTFRLYRRDGSRVLANEQVSDTQVSYSADSFTDGLYVWSVEGFARESETNSRLTGLAAMQSLNLRRLYPVALEHPSNGLAYTGLQAIRSPDRVRWSSRSSPNTAVYILARDSSLRNVIQRQENPPRTIALPQLGPGDYYWTVQARSADGFDITAATPAHFRVLPIPLLPAPRNPIPANGFRINPENLDEYRNLEFSWDAVPNANGYILTLYRGSGARREAVVQTPVQTGTSYTLGEIQQLGRGTFYWQVEAVNTAQNGSIDQHGTVQAIGLIIDIPLPQEIQTFDPGELYGR